MGSLVLMARLSTGYRVRGKSTLKSWAEMLEARHPIHRRYDAEDLVRLRRSSERRRYAASQRLGRIDPNPHQIDAGMFALRRIPEGGCILADEVGLGKTIEAGIIVAQMMAEGAARILIVVPKPLLGQWQDELYTLFGISAQEAADAGCDISAVWRVSGRSRVCGKRHRFRATGGLTAV